MMVIPISGRMSHKTCQKAEKFPTTKKLTGNTAFTEVYSVYSFQYVNYLITGTVHREIFAFSLFRPLLLPLSEGEFTVRLGDFYKKCH